MKIIKRKSHYKKVQVIMNNSLITLKILREEVWKSDADDLMDDWIPENKVVCYMGDKYIKNCPLFYFDKQNVLFVD